MTDMPPETREVIGGWGNTPRSSAHVVRPETRDELASAGKAVGPRGLIARGLGRAYGDSAMNAGGTVVVSTEVSGVLALDAAAGEARVLAGTSLDELMRAGGLYFHLYTSAHASFDDQSMVTRDDATFTTRT